MRRCSLASICSVLICLILAACSSPPDSLRSAPESGYTDWAAYGGGKDQIRYSRLTQFNRENVSKLTQAWVYDTGDVLAGSEIQCNPLVRPGT